MIDWADIADDLAESMMHRDLTPEEAYQFASACERLERSAEPAIEAGRWHDDDRVARLAV